MRRALKEVLANYKIPQGVCINVLPSVKEDTDILQHCAEVEFPDITVKKPSESL
jgi:hypothetical protein